MTAFTTLTAALHPPRLVAGIVTARLAATCEFYREHFGFRAIHGDGDMMVLARDDGARLELLRAGNPDQPAALQTPTRGTGLWLALDVDDADAQFARISQAGVEVIAPLEDASAGVRRFTIRDPNGVLVVVTEHSTATHRSVPSTAFQFADQP